MKEQRYSEYLKQFKTKLIKSIDFVKYLISTRAFTEICGKNTKFTEEIVAKSVQQKTTLEYG